jgi:uncharacterized protein (DUF849 family)
MVDRDRRGGGREASAAIAHPHARNREAGQPDQSPEAFPQDHQAANTVNNLTAGGSPTVRVDVRVRPAANFVKAPL